jgi:glyoxylase-like metal-dependent hydrolase (beta-lactamase superfamily II)
MAFRIDRIGERFWFAQAGHVNWVVYAGADGVTLVDSGYPGQRDLLVSSLDAAGCRLADVAAVLLTHGHVDHLGGAARLAREFGTPVHAATVELPNVRRDVLEQARPRDLVGAAWRPGVAAWGVAILPLMRYRPNLGVPSATALPLLADGRVAVPGRPRPIVVEGHTSGHTAFDFEDDGVLVVGDALATAHGTSTLTGPQLLPSVFHRDPVRARTSLDLLRSSAARVVLPGHGAAWIGPVDAAVDLALDAGSPW